MECTQKLECTQDLNETHSQRICPDEIGFLGICGTKYPVKKGPNKIGRDPQTCGIVLNLNSISRQHAVINVLSRNNFMIMDLDSANKTKLGGKMLQPYIPYALSDGDTVQFGDVFGIFRLLEQDDELPMTQAIDIPDTPISNNYMSRINKVPITMVPESPDVSDRDDSFVAPSQKSDRIESNHRFLKPSSKTISIQPIGSKKIDNIYWNSSKKSKSLSLSLDNSNASLDSSDPTVINCQSSETGNIHEMETQDPTLDNLDNVGTIHSAETQMPEDIPEPSIYSQNTQVVPTTNAQMPIVQKDDVQHEMQINLYTTNMEDTNDPYEAETQIYHNDTLKVSGTPRKNSTKSKLCTSNNSNDNISSSHEEIIFDEIDTQSCDELFESQSLLPEDNIPHNNENISSIEINKNNPDGKQELKAKYKRDSRVNSTESTDCEDIDIALTQIIPETRNISDEDVTDCEEVETDSTTKITDTNKENVDDIADLQTQIIKIEEPSKDEKRFEDMDTQIIMVDQKPLGKSLVENNPNDDMEFEDLPTQILVEDTKTINSKIFKSVEEDVNFEDLPTQVINEDLLTKPGSENLPDTENSQEIVESFKIPLAPIKSKRKVDPIVHDEIISIDDEKYYQSTQEVFEDLCSQDQNSPEVIGKNNNIFKKKPVVGNRTLNSIIDCVVGNNVPHNETHQNHISSNSDANNKVNKHVNNSPTRKGIEVVVQKLKRTHSDSSDLESTPKKGVALKFTDSDLPNSQEIKKSVHINPKRNIDDFSSDTETENNSQDDDTPLLFHKKKKKKKVTKLDLTKRFEADALPTRVITRVRKPTERAESYKKSHAILRPTFLMEQEDGINKEIITENISRLKTHNEKSKSHNKEASQISSGSNRKQEKEPEKLGALEDTSKARKSKEVDKKLRSIMSTDLMDKGLQKFDTSVEHNTSIRRTRSKNKVNNITKNEKHKSSENVKCESENNTSKSKASNTFLELETGDQSKTKLDSTKNCSKTKRRRKEKVETRSLSQWELKSKGTLNERTKKTPDKETKQLKLQDKETELRRSRRNKTKDVKEVDSAPPKLKAILKKIECDQSTIYNKSSDAVTESPSRMKRPTNNQLNLSSPKRVRCANDPNSTLRPPKIHHVLFTTFPEEGVQAKLEKLGAVTVTDVHACTVLLTSGLRRTFKLLCAVGLGRPVVGPSWVQACMHTNTIVDPWSYILKDVEAEKRFHFDLERTLLGKRNYLNGYTVSSTPSVLPAAPEMKQIVECSGGVWGEGGERWVVVSTPRDSALWPVLSRRGATLVTSEFVLAGVLRQTADLQRYLYK